MNREAELEQTAVLSRRIVEATSHLFSGHPVSHQILQACSVYDQQCRDILIGRGLPVLSIAIIGTKGQGKTWIARQFVRDPVIQKSLPSGVLTHEATTQLYWIGPVLPESIDTAHEKFIYCPSEAMLDLEHPYMLLDTPGTTDANLKASEIARATLLLSPIQILVVRRDQLRSSTTSPLAERSEGVICMPVITCIPQQEWNESRERDRGTFTTSAALQSDVNRWLKMINESAPQSQVLEPIMIADFEATGDEAGAGEHFKQQLKARLHGQPLEGLAKTISNRLAGAGDRLKHQIHRLLQAETPQLSRAVLRLQEEARLLPRRAIESVLGSPIVLETAIRARLRTQIVADTSPLCFPYRTTLSLLSFTHGAWDRLILAMTGSIPSIFGTFVAWARNVQQSRKIDWDMQQGLRERLNGQVHDQLAPIQQQFHRALAALRGETARSLETSLQSSSQATDSAISLLHLSGEGAVAKSRDYPVRLNGVDELQSRSRLLFEQMLLQHRSSRWWLLLLAFAGTVIFWILLAGPIVSVYRQYVIAAFRSLTLTVDSDFVSAFHYPSMHLIVTSVVLSFIPMLLYAMVAFACLLRRSKIERLAQRLQSEHHALVDELQQNSVLCLEFEDPLLEKAQFLLALDRQRIG